MGREDITSLDKDKQLAAARRNLITVALVLLTINIAGAELSKVNGLIFELTFESPGDLVFLLAAGTGFLLLRYYNHAAKYHDITYQAWTEKLMSDDLINYVHQDSDEPSGLWWEWMPNNVSYDFEHAEKGDSIGSGLRRKLLFNAEFLYKECRQGYKLPDRGVSILRLWKQDKSKYFKVIGLIIKYWLLEQVKARQSLYLYAPYFIGLLALLSLMS